MDLKVEIKGDLAIQRRFQTAGDRVRESVSDAVRTLLGMAQATAQSRAPRGKTNRLREGIITWVGGAGWYKPPNNGNAITNFQIERYKELAKDKGSIYGVVTSTWHTGRYFERGVNKKVWVGPRPMQARYNAYNKSYFASLRNRAKNAGLGPITAEAHEKYAARAARAGERAMKKAQSRGKGFWRQQRLAARPFMAPARDSIASIYQGVIQDAVTKAVSSGG